MDLLQEIQKRAQGSSPLGSTLKFKLGDKVIFLDGSGDSNVVSGDDKDADCTISVSEEDMTALMTGDLNPMMAFMGGKIKVDGDMGVAMKLQSIVG